jgi:hypothetical protein
MRPAAKCPAFGFVDANNVNKSFSLQFADLAPRAYRLLKRSTRPAVSTSFCLPVKNGWQDEQISTWSSRPSVERVLKEFPQAQTTVISS